MHCGVVLVLVLCCLSIADCIKSDAATKCIPLKECSFAMDMVYNDKYAPSTIEFLRNADCGFSEKDGPLINCPMNPPQSQALSCITFDGRNGTCKIMDKCKSIIGKYLVMGDVEACKKYQNSSDNVLLICCQDHNPHEFDTEVPKGYVPMTIDPKKITLQEVATTTKKTESFTTTTPENKVNRSINITEDSVKNLYKEFLDNMNNNTDIIFEVMSNEDLESKESETKNTSTKSPEEDVSIKNVFATTERSIVPVTKNTNSKEEKTIIFPQDSSEVQSRKRPKHQPGKFRSTFVVISDEKKFDKCNKFYMQYKNAGDKNQYKRCLRSNNKKAKNNHFKKPSVVEVFNPGAFSNEKRLRGRYFFGRPPRRHIKRMFQPRYNDYSSSEEYFREQNFNNGYDNIENRFDIQDRNSNELRPTCGIEGRVKSSRIVGGLPVALGEYPWMALIQYKGSSGIKNGCGGSLINNKYLLTAAHCVDDGILQKKKMKLYRVILGEYDTSKNPDCFSEPRSICAEPTRIYEIDTITKHPHFDNVRAKNDVALLKLDREVVFNDFIRPICLPTSGFSFDNGESAMVAGWGKTEDKGEFSKILKKAVLPIEEKETCNRMGVKLDKGQVCLGFRNGVDTCTGDSGGPLMVQKMEDQTLVTYQFGIVSYGFASESCGNAPSVNTYIPYYLKWILNVINK